MMRALLVAATLTVSCGHPAQGGDDPQRQPPEPVRFDKPAMVQFHMRRQLDDLRKVERLLIAGKLDEARTRAAALTLTAPDPGMARWQREVDAVTEAARALVAAPSIDEACRREARVAEACAQCHLDTQKLPVFAVPVIPPPDDPAPAARMARHQWPPTDYGKAWSALPITDGASASTCSRRRRCTSRRSLTRLWPGLSCRCSRSRRSRVCQRIPSKTGRADTARCL